MKFYRIDYFASDPTETATEWETSMAKAAKIARENRCGDYSAKITTVDIPMSKEGLKAFLNENIWSHPNHAEPWGG